MKKSITIIFILFISLTTSRLYAGNYYWVGGSGSWTDLTHWATASGGTTKRTVLPTLSDDVFFDANSFTAASQIVTITFGATCRSMDWTGATNSPTISSFFDDINIYGSLILPASVGRDFLGNVHLKATSGTYNINLNNLPLSTSNNEALSFEGAGGTWMLQGDVTIYRINVTGGTLNTNGRQITCSIFNTSGSTNRNITLGASVISCASWDVTSSAGLTFSAGTSSITSTFRVNGKNLTYNNLIISGTVEVYDNNTFNAITLQASSILKLKEGSTQTITTLLSNGTSANPVTIKSVTDGSVATLSSASAISINNVILQDNTAIGTGSPFLAPIGSVDLGNVTGWNIGVTEPNTQASSPNFFKVLSTSVDLRWTNGSGAKRIVVARLTATANVPPTDMTAYTAGAFGAGTPTGTGNYVVYSGNGSATTITGLTAGAAYTFAIYEYNGSGSGADFLTKSPATIGETTLPTTAVVISNSPSTVCSGKYYSSGGLYYYSNNENFTQTLTPATASNKLRLTFVGFFTNGSGDVLKIYDGPTTAAPLLGTFSGSSLPPVVTATNAAGQLTMQFVSDASFTSTGWEADLSCVTLDTQPTIVASGLTFSNVTGSSMTLNWTNGNGAKRIVIAKAGSAVTLTPADGTDFTANAAFGAGTNLSTGNYVLYNGNGNTVNITGLSSNTTYNFSIVEYNGANTSVNYFTPGTTGSKVTTTLAAEPTVSASGATTTFRSASQMSLGWTIGNGSNRVVVMRQGSAVNATPVDGVAYTTPSSFTTATDLGGGNKVIYSGSGNLASIAGLSALTTYYFAVYEFNGTAAAGTPNYLLTTPATVSASTLASPPTTLPTAINTTSLLFTSFTLTWANGNGEKSIVIVEVPGSTGTAQNGTEYTPNTAFGLGSKVGTNAYVVYVGTGTSVTVTGLQSNTTYNVRIHSYNGSGNVASYLISNTLSPFTTLRMKPTVAATNLQVANTGADSVKLTWQRGNGDYCMVVARAMAATSMLIKDSTVLAGNAYAPHGRYPYGEGTDLGNNTIAVYQGTGTSISVGGLNPATTYYFAVVEFNSVYISSVAKSYNYFLTTSAPTANATTLAGKNYYWVGGTGKWSDYLHHWATGSGGTTFHSSVPSSADNVYFNSTSFFNATDTVYMDTNQIFCKDMDWSGITKSATFSGLKYGYRCSHILNVYGSLRFSSFMNLDLSSIYFKATTKGNSIDIANKTSFGAFCATNVTFSGYEGEWTLTGDLSGYYMNIMGGKLIATKSKIDFYQVDFYSNIKKTLELGNSTMTLSGWNASDQNNTITVNGGTLILSSTTTTQFDASGAHYRKVIWQSKYASNSIAKILGGATIDSLEIKPGLEVQFESGKTFNIDKFTLNGDSTKTTTIRSTIPGVAAIISKPSGSINVKYVILKDNQAMGGAQFNAASSVDAGNVSGWNIVNPPVFLPKVSASSIEFRKVFTTNLKMRWQHGDGIKRIVVAKEGTPVDRTPINSTLYSGNQQFGSGTNLGNGNFAVYTGSADTTNVTGLTPGKKYHFAIFEYNEWSSNTKYKITSPAIANVATPSASDVLISNSPVSVCNVKFFDDGGRGYYTKNKVIIQTITPSTAGTKLGVLFTYFELAPFDTLLIYNGNSVTAPVLGKFNSSVKPQQAMIATNASGVLTFKLKGANSSASENAYKGWEAELFCAGTSAPSPTIQCSSLLVTAKTENSISIKVNKGNGSGRMIIAKEASAVSKLPINGTAFAASTSFGDGTHLGDGNYIVYSGPDETATITGLKGNTIYHFAAMEYNGTSGSTNYLLTTKPLTSDTTLMTPPTVPSSSMVFSNVTTSSITLSVTPGNGSSRIIVARKGKPVTVSPTDGVVYTASPYFGYGQSIGDSTYVVGNITWTGTTVYYLKLATNYYFKVFEYNGSLKKSRYLTSSSVEGSQMTKAPKLTLGKINTSYCPNDVLEAGFSLSQAFNPGNKFTLQLSDASGNFNSPVNLKDTVITAFTGYIKAHIPNSSSGGTSYRLRIVSSSPSVISDSLSHISIGSIPDVTFTQNGKTFTSSSSMNNQWLLNGVDIPGATAQTYVPTKGGNYAVKVRVGDCFKISAPVIITGIEKEVHKDIITLYPSPAHDQVIIEMDCASGVYVIADTQGRQLLTGALTGNKTKVNISEIASGLFFIIVNTNQSSSTTMLVKE